MLRVVLADDEKKVLLLMCKLIDWESLGFEIVGMASDGMHALEMIRDKQPHLLVTDIRMPVMDGLAATRCIRESDYPDSRTVPIVAMTANVFEEDVKKSFDAGMNAHLSKPVDIKQMYAVLDELVNGDGLL